MDWECTSCLIYHSFWAYDVTAKCWHKVDIRDHGYKLGKLASAENTTEGKASSKSSSFWKNLAIDVRIGTGPTFYRNEITQYHVIDREGKDFFLQTSGGKAAKESYKINWFGAGYTKLGDPRAGSKGLLDIIQMIF